MKLVVIAWVLTPSHPPPSVRAELVEAGARSLILLHACVKGGSRVVAPAGDSLSFASPKESKQRKGDPTVCVPALRFGQPAVLASSGVSLELAALRFAQTIASPDPLAAALLGAYRGDGEPNIQTATRAIAALGPGGASWRLMWLGLFLPTSSGWPPSPFG